MAYHDNEYKPDSPKKTTGDKEELIVPPNLISTPEQNLIKQAEAEFENLKLTVLSSKRQLFLDNKKQIKDYLPQQITPQSPQQLSSKRKNFLSMTGKLSDYSSARLNREALTGYEAYIESKELVKKIVGSVLDPCNLDIVIAMTIAHGGASWDPGGPGSQATYAWRWSRQVAWANAVINDLTPLMNSNNAQVGICAWSGHPHPHPNDPLYPNTTPNPKFPYHYDPIQFSTTSGKW